MLNRLSNYLQRKREKRKKCGLVFSGAKRRHRAENRAQTAVAEIHFRALERDASASSQTVRKHRPSEGERATDGKTLNEGIGKPDDRKPITQWEMNRR